MSDLSQNLYDSYFSDWITAVYRSINGTGVARIACVGDSTTEGVGATVLANVYPEKLVGLLSSGGYSACDGAIWAHSSWYTDSRISEGSGWSFWDDQGWGGGTSGVVRAWTATTSTAGKLSFTFSHSIDSIRVFYARTTTSGTFTVDVGGSSLGSAVTANAGGNAAGKTDFTCSAGTHTININPPTVGDVFIMGVEAWLSTAHPILVTNAGSGGSQTVNWALTGLPWRKLQVFDLYQPDLTVISLGINDAISGNSATTVETNLTSIVTKAQLYGDVILCSMIPSKASTPAGTSVLPNEILYLPKIVNVSNDKSCGLLDLFHAFGESGDVANTNGYMSDSYHPNDSGYSLMASSVYSAIQSAQNPRQTSSTGTTGMVSGVKHSLSEPTNNVRDVT